MIIVILLIILWLISLSIGTLVYDKTNLKLCLLAKFTVIPILGIIPALLAICFVSYNAIANYLPKWWNDVNELIKEIKNNK